MLGVRLTKPEREIIARAASRLCTGGYTRRGFLGAAGTLVLAGCGVDEARKEPPTDADVLDGLLRTELAAGKAVIGSPIAELLVRQDAQHARRLASLAGLALIGREPTEAIELPAALMRKQEAVLSYVAALPKLADPDVRAVVMQILAGEAEQLAALRLADGQEPVPDPFAGFLDDG